MSRQTKWPPKLNALPSAMDQLVPLTDTQSSAHQSQSDSFWVVKNHEEQYSIWPTWRQVPLGWVCVGQPQDKEQALNWIEANWTDMRPASLRRWLEETANNG